MPFNVTIDSTQQVVARAHGVSPNGTIGNPPDQPTWVSSDPTIARIAGVPFGGLAAFIYGMSVGVATMTVSCAAYSSSFTVTVVAPPPDPSVPDHFEFTADAPSPKP